ncbi:uncharacterized protein LOC121374014 [Gigantopelta aegis]|uniref:uncharacterized protein LOC121374014 n=1 Tax=Gigantopelta aegis TaxID=1735272 RepID=UPI001B88E317|nr:uncharacterized protein LOC121374014 [Gigantopelta aegis]
MRSVTMEEGELGATVLVSSDRSMSMLIAEPSCEDVNPASDEPTAHVTLPQRYKQQLNKTKSAVPRNGLTDDLISREKDLGIALRWIRQEILQMKEQDKCLLKQFVDLRASILQLRCMYQLQGSTPDVSSLEGSTTSLTDVAAKHRKCHVGIPRADSDFLDFSSRTKSLMSLQNSPQFTRLKWKSDEFI